MPHKAKLIAAFSKRLVAAMKAAGHISTGNHSGADVGKLAKAAGTTYEMARRYVEGQALPRAPKLERIARWLGTSSSALLYGQEEPQSPRQTINTETLQACIEAAKRAEQLAGAAIPPEKMAKLVALLYEEAAEGRQVASGMLPRLLRLI